MFRLLAAGLHDPKRDPLGRSWTDARHLPQLRDQIPNRRRVFRFPQNGGPLLVQRCIGQLQGERLEPAEIQLQRTIFFIVGAARILKLRVGFGPSFFSIKHDAIPESVAPRNLIP